MAKLLDVPVAWLWPGLDEDSAGESRQEVVAFYPHRADTPKRLWLELLLGAKERIDLFANASLFLPEDNPESIDLIRHKARAASRSGSCSVTRTHRRWNCAAGKNASTTG